MLKALDKEWDFGFFFGLASLNLKEKISLKCNII
jgi:hypothetical protein